MTSYRKKLIEVALPLEPVAPRVQDPVGEAGVAEFERLRDVQQSAFAPAFIGRG